MACSFVMHEHTSTQTFVILCQDSFVGPSLLQVHMGIPENHVRTWDLNGSLMDIVPVCVQGQGGEGIEKILQTKQLFFLWM